MEVTRRRTSVHNFNFNKAASPSGSPRTSIPLPKHSNATDGDDDEDLSKIWDDLPKKYRIKKRGVYIRRQSDLKISSNSTKFLLLMWKNYLVTKRRWKTSLLQFAVPIFLVAILTIISSIEQTTGLYTGNASDDEIQVLLPAYLVAGFGVSCLVMIYQSVREKEMGIQTLLKMYGVSVSFHKYAWILHNLLFHSLSSFFIALILLTNWTSTITGTSIFAEDIIAEFFFVLLICYMFNVICTVILLVCFFSRGIYLKSPILSPSEHFTLPFVESGITACIGVTFLWIMSYVPYVYIYNYYNILPLWGKILSCIPCNSALGMGCLLIAKLQANEDESDWDAVFKGTKGNTKDKFRLGYVMIIMLVTGLVELFLAEYISNVDPDSELLKLPWNYILKAWYWKGQLPPEDKVPTGKLLEKSFQEIHPDYFENDISIKRRKELWLDNISKYRKEHRTLHKINMICHQGFITVLFGGKGSGKSTLLKIISGSLVPTGGYIYLSRKDLYKNPIFGRAFVGYCPSGNHLFPDLTVNETLHFFAELKGMSKKIEAYDEVERLLGKTMLLDFRDTTVCELTKSSQRMLLVATAFCGGSRVVLLDDPTLHLNEAERKVLWDFAANEKKHRTILVAMDFVHDIESVSVVDQVVVLHNGEVTAMGSPEFLRNKFGGGYYSELQTIPNVFYILSENRTE